MSTTASEQRTYVSATVFDTWMVVLSDGKRLSFKQATHSGKEAPPKDGEQIQVLIDYDGRRPFIKSWKR